MSLDDIRQEIAAPAVAVVLLVAMCYLAGRVHQYFKQTTEREQAYRDGYNTATRSLFSLATRTARLQVKQSREQQEQRPVRGFASVTGEQRSPLPARHRAEGRRGPSPADTARIESEWPAQHRAA